MRRLFAYGLTIALLAACSTQEKDFQTPQQEDVIYYASFEQPAEDGTRVYANDDLLLRWTADDRVSIFGKNTYNQQYKFLGETGDNSGGFNKVDGAEYVTGNPISHTVSVYPYQASTKITEDEVLAVTLPAEQHYAENTFGLGANTMVSVSEDNVLQYKNVGGYLVLKLYGEGVSVSSITLKGNNGEKLAGQASVTMPLDGVPSAVFANDASDEITLVCDSPVILGATAEESVAFWIVVPPVTFSKGITIRVSSADGIFRKTTDKTLVIERSKLSKMASLDVQGAVSVPEVIDLGLPSGVKWASFNMGASLPEEFGDYYAWGETEPYYTSMEPLIWKEGKDAGYDWASYKWSSGTSHSLTKYCQHSSYGYNGFTDDKVILDPEDDVAQAYFGGSWRMPTDEEFTELRVSCTWKWVTLHGISGCRIVGPNGNSIFLPAAGYREGTYRVKNEGDYWSSSLNASISGETSGMSDGWGLFFHSTGIGYRSSSYRCKGRSIRPVYGDLPIPVESLFVDSSSLDMIVGREKTLQVSVMPENATYKMVLWSCDKPSVAKVSSSGVVTAIAPGRAIITATAFGGKTITCNVVVRNSLDPLPETVDLGLPSGVKWASFNLGASKPEEYGDYYAWGEVEPYYSSLDPLTWKEGKEAGYGWASYKWCNGSNTSLTKYCNNSYYGYEGFTDTKVVLDPEDDAAHVILGGNWRMPTDAEWTELRDKCTWTWTTQNGVNGRLVTANNGNSIFLPVAGLWNGTNLGDVGSLGNYWSSSLCTGYPVYALGVIFDSNNVIIMYEDERFYGFSVRPVCD